MADNMRTPDENPSEPLAFDERTRRVLDLRKQIRAGTYSPDAKAVAEAMLSDWMAIGERMEAADILPHVESPSDRRAAGERFVVAKSEVEDGDETRTEASA